MGFYGSNDPTNIVKALKEVCEDMSGRYCCLTSFFRLSICALVAKILPDKVVRWCPDDDFLGPAFPASCAQHISDFILNLY